MGEAGNANAIKLVKYFGSRAIPVKLFKGNPVVIADALSVRIQGIGKKEASIKCAVDITTFTHEALLILLKVLGIFLPEGSTVTYVYTPAKEYDPGTPVEDKWLSRGLGSVRSVLGYAGTWISSRKVHLIVLVGFESDRAKKLIDAYEPDALSLGIGGVDPFSAS